MAKNRDQVENELYEDVEKIKLALSQASRDVKVTAGKVLSESIASTDQTVLQLKRSVEEYITNKPFQSMGITLLIGGIIGYLIGKK